MEGNPLMDLAPSKRIEVSELSEWVVFDPVSHEPLSLEVSMEHFAQVWMLRERMGEASKGLKEDENVSLMEFMHSDEVWMEAGNRAKALFSLAHFLANIEGVSLEACSIHEFGVEGFHGDQGLLVDGYDSVTEELSKGIRDRIILDCEVAKIDYSEGSHVKIFSKRGVFTARHTIVTIPLGVLKKHHQSLFNPPLPPSNKNAIKMLGFGLLDKVILKYESAAWPMDQEGFISFCPELSSPGFLTFVNLGKYTNQAVLVCLVAHECALYLESLSDAEVEALIARQVERMFKNVGKPVQFLMTRWNKDPFALGSYSHLTTASKPKHFSDLASPVGINSSKPTVFFAGEHTTYDHMATVQGAFISGQQAAEQVVGLIRTNKTSRL
ncbi:hypothetical protein HDV05_007894 [Chytridiales sp. JEL 0842]|nr:hypothetical protein HDV05_007894 [Chytridiales sp. JEL 0842]